MSSSRVRGNPQSGAIDARWAGTQRTGACAGLPKARGGASRGAKCAARAGTGRSHDTDYVQVSTAGQQHGQRILLLACWKRAADALQRPRWVSCARPPRPGRATMTAAARSCEWGCGNRPAADNAAERGHGQACRVRAGRRVRVRRGPNGRPCQQPPAARRRCAAAAPYGAGASLPLQRRRLQHLARQLRRGVGEAHVCEQLREPAARGVVRLEARGERGVAQQLGQALAQRLARPGGGERLASTKAGRKGVSTWAARTGRPTARASTACTSRRVAAAAAACASSQTRPAALLCAPRVV